MEHNELRKKLKKYGYTRKTECLSEFSNKTVLRRKFTAKSLNHTNLCNSPVIATNFNNAALTGSYFNNCDFRNCHMDMSDFEYCEFYNCYFTSKHTVISSFNESNFLDTVFENISFSGCSFAGSFFENCTFKNVTIEYTTFENSIFRNCIFQDMNMKVLNLDYIEFENPKMNCVVLPLEQIAHSIGLLEYCKQTDDNISIGSDSTIILTKEEYWEKVIPLLEREYLYSKEYFPLSNIYLAKMEYEKANEVLHHGLQDAVSKRDFRILKFYCKLIKKSHYFDSHALHSFYHSICRLSPNPIIIENNSLLRGYIRNIAEIKNILFDSTRKPTLHMALLTNLSSKQHDHIGKLLSQLFGITKMGHFKIPNNTSLKVSENSPLIIDLDVAGEEENIACIFSILLYLSNTKCDIPFLDMDNININEKKFVQLKEQAEQCRLSCIELNITMELVECYFENCMQIISSNQNVYYYNSNLKQYQRRLKGI